MKKLKGILKTSLAVLGGLFILIMILGSCLDEETTEPKEAETKETVVKEEKPKKEAAAKEEDKEEITKEPEEETTPKEKMINDILQLVESKQAFDTGSYTKGDIPQGEYAFITFNGSGQYYSEEDPSGNIIDNENFDTFGYVFVHGVGNIQTRGILVNPASFEVLGVTSAKQIYEILNDVTGHKDSGVYKIGVDLPPGQYTLESYGEGYVEINTGAIGNGEIIDNEIFNGKYSVTVSEGQYLKISRSYIVQ